MANITKEITKEKEGIKLTNYLKYELKMSTRLVRRLFREGRVIINGESKRASYELSDGDLLDIIIDVKETQDVEPQDIDIDIAYEDGNILVVNKPPFMVVHPTKSHRDGTLSNAVAYYSKKTNQDFIVRLVNRLDRDTSGLVIIAKNQFAHQDMAQKMERNEIKKYYIAVVKGNFSGSGVIDKPIGRPTLDSIKREVMDNGQRAVTYYESLNSGVNMSSVILRLETGKTHQIRVHLSYLGYPIIGDTLYGQESELINRQALHALKLEFVPPGKDKIVQVISSVPDDIQLLLNNINAVPAS
ncbi:MAG TPA: RluA family pseudouridine synthase [Clostridiaceae bacterium]|nr:RluA family pseudouridine synthase [Clostridiaceae bacterium]HBG38896.1 RluA family pseudouridine synthase [Clostridiaceae bacterium]HBN28608.1 RluA family pseudouridine synthase [Clostridiaceae bacterium]HCL49845.1 RluA family pseudouridine synthase [Clostridiaceae bacterium]